MGGGGGGGHDTETNDCNAKPLKDINVNTFMDLMDKVHHAHNPILWTICCNTYTMCMDTSKTQDAAMPLLSIPTQTMGYTT